MSASQIDNSKVIGTSAIKTQLESSLTTENTGLELTVVNTTYKWNGTSFDTISISGAELVSTVEYKISSYTGKISSAEDGTTFAIATGARKLMLQSLDMAVAGTAEYAVIAFGTSAADAQANLTITGTTPNKIATTGAVIGSSTKVGEPPLILGIPANATHVAVGNGIAATVVQLMVTQGT